MLKRVKAEKEKAGTKAKEIKGMQLKKKKDVERRLFEWPTVKTVNKCCQEGD